MRNAVRSRRIAGWVITAAAVCMLAGGGAPNLARAPRAQAAVAGPAALARGWARVTMAGTLVSAPSTGLVPVAVGAPSKAEVFEGGTAWQTRPLYGTHPVRLLPQMVVVDGAARPIALEVLRAGDHVTVWGVMSPDNEIMALSMMVSTTRPAARPAAPAAAPTGSGVAGVVAARSGSMLDLVTDTGTRHAVVLTAATQVRADGLAAASAISPFDVVQIDGAVNSDGSVVAARISVEFPASQAAQLSGPIEAVHSDLGGLIVDGTMVCTSARTYFVRGASRLWIAQMAAGHPVTVYGLPILAGKTAVGLSARVVAVR